MITKDGKLESLVTKRRGTRVEEKTCQYKSRAQGKVRRGK